MKDYGPFPRPHNKGGKYIMLAIPKGLPVLLRNAGLIMVLIAVSNYATYRFTLGQVGSTAFSALNIMAPKDDLYLMDKAQTYVQDVQGFGQKVRQVAERLGVPPEWLMAVMYAESGFDVGVYNHKGSGAVGLIQFMPSTARDLNVSSEQLSRMGHSEQLDYVYTYLQRVKDQHGPYKSLVDLYLGILYPKALSQDPCYTLFSKPSRAYSQNSGLDENRDGRISVSDIDRRMARLFPSAYAIGRESNSEIPL
ncbi:MAG: transglycosylase SLT domain-containing protein [Bacteroidota bacterium]